MDPVRAKEIAASPVMVDVTYHGTLVYIDRIAGDNQTAYIHPLNQPDNRQIVKIAGLIEQ